MKFETKRQLAAKVFRHTAAYDAIIANYMTELAGLETPEKLTVTYELKQPSLWRKSTSKSSLL